MSNADINKATSKPRLIIPSEMRVISFSLVLVVGVASINLRLPHSFSKCSKSDPEFDECLKNAIQGAIPLLSKGMTSLNFESIEPINIPALSIGAGTGTVHVEQHYYNVDVHNIDKIKLSSVKSTFTDQGIDLYIEGVADSIIMEGEYSLHGNILIFPISGNDTCTLTITNVNVTQRLIGKEVVRKNKPYYEFEESYFTMNPDLLVVDFKNLFNGDPLLGPEMNKIINDNWYEVFHDVKEGYEHVLGLIILERTNKIFRKVPHNTIFLP